MKIPLAYFGMDLRATHQYCRTPNFLATTRALRESEPYGSYRDSSEVDVFQGGCANSTHFLPQPSCDPPHAGYARDVPAACPLWKRCKFTVQALRNLGAGPPPKLCDILPNVHTKSQICLVQSGNCEATQEGYNIL